MEIVDGSSDRSVDLVRPKTFDHGQIGKAMMEMSSRVNTPDLPLEPIKFSDMLWGNAVEIRIKNDYRMTVNESNAIARENISKYLYEVASLETLPYRIKEEELKTIQEECKVKQEEQKVLQAQSREKQLLHSVSVEKEKHRNGQLQVFSNSFILLILIGLGIVYTNPHEKEMRILGAVIIAVGLYGIYNMTALFDFSKRIPKISPFKLDEPESSTL